MVDMMTEGQARAEGLRVEEMQFDRVDCLENTEYWVECLLFWGVGQRVELVNE